MIRRWLGLDLGERYWGIAVARPEDPPAQPLEVLEARDRVRALKRVRDLIRDYCVGTVVAGVPLARGHWTRASEKIYQIVRWLVAHLPEVEWRFIDESLTTLDASLEAAPGQRPDDRAAAMILERALYHDAPLWDLTDLDRIRAAGGRDRTGGQPQPTSSSGEEP